MNNAKDFQVLDTAVIQVRSVLNFMYTLGYTLDTEVNSGRFVTEQKALQGNRYISATNAVRLHNLPIEDWQVYQNEDATIFYVLPKGVNFQAGLSPLAVRLAFGSKLVEQVKFSVKRSGDIVVQDSMVKPVNKAVLELVQQS